MRKTAQEGNQVQEPKAGVITSRASTQTCVQEPGAWTRVQLQETTSSCLVWGETVHPAAPDRLTRRCLRWCFCLSHGLSPVSQNRAAPVDLIRNINGEIKQKCTPVPTFLGKLWGCCCLHGFFKPSRILDMKGTYICTAVAYVCPSPSFLSTTQLCCIRTEAWLKIIPKSTSSFDFSLHQQPRLTVP